jgi:hypothetical protein
MKGFAPVLPPGDPFDSTGPYQNPGSTQPFPQPNNVPAPGWFGPNYQLDWRGAASGNTNDISSIQCRFAIWRSPTFDLRPEFRGVVQSESITTSGVQPIWRPGGAGGQLLIGVHFGNNGNSSLLDLNIVSYDEASPWDPNNLWPITAEQDVTTTFTTANQSGLGFQPPQANRGVNGIGTFQAPGGSGGPVRYWRLVLVFRFWLQHDDPLTSVTAAYY